MSNKNFYNNQTEKTNYNPNKYPNTNNNINNNLINNFSKAVKKTERTVSHKIVIIGDANVGKTCLITRFNHNKFDSTTPTIGAIHHIKTVENITLDIWDTAGQERFKSMIPMYYKGARAVIICFDITNPDSFEGAQNWYTEIFQSVEKAIIILCGTKNDLEPNRRVDLSDTKKFADRKGIRYFETSAKDDFNIHQLFGYIAEQITLHNLKKEIEGVDLNANGSSSNGKKLQKDVNKEKLGYSKLKTKCCAA